MEARHDSDKVRPVTIGADHNGTTDAPPPDEPPSGRPRIRRFAIAAVVAGVVVVAGAIVLLGGVEFSDPPPPTTLASGPDEAVETTDTSQVLPPELSAVLPTPGATLDLIAVDAAGDLSSLHWEPDFRVPQVVDRILELDGQAVEPWVALYDATQQNLAVQVRTDDGIDVHIGSTRFLTPEPVLTDVLSAVWNSSLTGQLAFTTPNGDDTTTLSVASIDLRGGLGPTTDVTTLDGSVSVLRWDPSGFVIGAKAQLSRDTRVSALGPDGTELWTRPGIPMSVSPSLVAVIRRDDQAFGDRWELLDRATGERTVLAEDLPVESSLLLLTSRSNRVAQIEMDDDGATVTVFGPDLAAPRIAHIVSGLGPRGFSNEASTIVLGGRTNDLVFLDWRTGAARTLPVPDGYAVIGASIG